MLSIDFTNSKAVRCSKAFKTTGFSKD